MTRHTGAPGAIGRAARVGVIGSGHPSSDVASGTGQEPVMSLAASTMRVAHSKAFVASVRPIGPAWY